jgi:hypothetical protein
MKNESTTFEFHHEKKDYITRQNLERLLKEIKSALSKSKNVKILMTTTD